jgi:hypothetical protein
MKSGAATCAVASLAFVAATVVSGAGPAAADSKPSPAGSAPKAGAAKAQMAAKPKGGAKAGGGSTAIAGADPRMALGVGAAGAGALVLGAPLVLRARSRRLSVAR